MDEDHFYQLNINFNTVGWISFSGSTICIYVLSGFCLPSKLPINCLYYKINSSCIWFCSPHTGKKYNDLASINNVIEVSPVHKGSLQIKKNRHSLFFYQTGGGRYPKPNFCFFLGDLKKKDLYVLKHEKKKKNSPQLWRPTPNTNFQMPYCDFLFFYNGNKKGLRQCAKLHIWVGLWLLHGGKQSQILGFAQNPI